jgi:hypothetical protein
MDFGLPLNERQGITEAVNRHPGKALLFLGAGASKPWGLPIMNEFFEAVYGDDVRSRIYEYINHYREVRITGNDPDAEVRLRLLLLAKNIYGNLNDHWDLEAVVTVLYKIGALNEQEITGSPESLLYGLYCDYYESMKVPPGDFIAFAGKAYVDIYNFLMPKIVSVYKVSKSTSDGRVINRAYSSILETLRAYSKSPVPVFTTNYDLVLEKYVFQNDYFDGFIPAHDTEFPVFAVRNLVDYLKTGNYKKPLLIKLHGSLNWMGKGEETEKYSEEIPFEEYENVDYILPIIGKGIEENKPVFRYKYSIFADYVKKPDLRLILVIGSSLRDVPVLRIIQEGFRSNENLFMIITSKPLSDLSAGRIDQKTLRRSGKIAPGVVDFYAEFEDRVIPIPFYFHDQQENLIRSIEGYIDQKEMFKGSFQ